jgi:hypothetical protein
VKPRDRLEGEIGAFVRQYARRKHAGHDPNDRRYDRELERTIKHMDPRELDLLMRGEDEDESHEVRDADVHGS